MSEQITIERFVNDCNYVGNSFEGGGLFYDYWLETLKAITPEGYPKYQEWVSTGGIGTGKTTAAVVNLLFNVCNLILDENRHKTFGTTSDCRFIFAIVNPKSSKSMGGSAEWQLCNRMMVSSPFFSCSYTTSEKGNMIDFNDAPVSIYSVSKVSESLGLNIAGAIFSTCDVEATGKELDVEGFTQLYYSILRRAESRFLGNDDGSKKFPGSVMLVSLFNKRDFIPLVRERIDAISNRQAPDAFWSNSSVITVKKKAWKFSGKTFPVFLGSDPQILDPSETDEFIQSHIIQVPMELKEYFEKDIKMALQDIAGIRPQYSRD
jgi:hypothetical protein